MVGLAAIARTVGHLSKSAEVMKLVNNLMKAPEVAATMLEFSKEMTKVVLFFFHLGVNKVEGLLLVTLFFFSILELLCYISRDVFKVAPCIHTALVVISSL